MFDVFSEPLPLLAVEMTIRKIACKENRKLGLRNVTGSNHKVPLSKSYTDFNFIDRDNRYSKSLVRRYPSCSDFSKIAIF